MTDLDEDITAPAEKTIVRSLRITPSAWAEVQARAERAGMLVNSYVVWAISRAPERKRDADAPLALTDGKGGTPLSWAPRSEIDAAAAAVVVDDEDAAGAWMLEQAARTADEVVADLHGTFAPSPDAALPDGVEGWPRCGHPKTPENTQKRGKGRAGTCRTCREVVWKASRERIKAAKAG